MSVKLANLGYRDVDTVVAHFLVVQAPGGVAGGDILFGDTEQHESPVQDDAKNCAFFLAKLLLIEIGQFHIQVLLRVLIDVVTHQSKDLELGTIDQSREVVVEVARGLPFLKTGLERECSIVEEEGGLKSIPREAMLNESETEGNDILTQRDVVMVIHRIQIG